MRNFFKAAASFVLVVSISGILINLLVSVVFRDESPFLIQSLIVAAGLASLIELGPSLSTFIKHREVVAHLLRLILMHTKEKENIIGDLLEEYSQFTSRVNANLWLCKQVVKSVLALTYNFAKSRLASYLGERIR